MRDSLSEQADERLLTLLDLVQLGTTASGPAVAADIERTAPVAADLFGVAVAADLADADSFLADAMPSSGADLPEITAPGLSVAADIEQSASVAADMDPAGPAVTADIDPVAPSTAADILESSMAADPG